MSVDELLDELKSITPPGSPEQAAGLERGLERLAVSVQPLTDAQMDRVFRLLSDSSPYQDVMWSVLGVIEAQGNAKYVDAFARNLRELIDNGAGEWADTMACRIMNGEMEDDLLNSIQRYKSVAALKLVLGPVATSKGSVATKAASLLERLEGV